MRNLTKDEIEEAYEKNTGILIADYFKDKDYEAVPAVLCKNHGPFTWGKDAHEAVHNAVVLEEVAKMASRCELINPDVNRRRRSFRINITTENMAQMPTMDREINKKKEAEECHMEKCGILFLWNINCGEVPFTGGQ